MTVPIVWYGDKPGILNRGYWDEGMFESAVAGRMWRPGRLPVFSHHAGFAELPPGCDGAIVAVPARWFADQARLINAEISRLQWALVVLFGDEEGEFPWQDLRHPTKRLKVWVQTGHPGRHPSAGMYRWIPNGWPPDCPTLLRQMGDDAANRQYNWWFAGQLNNDRRDQCCEALGRRRQARNDGQMRTTRIFGSGLPYDRYLQEMVSTRVCPAPSGTYSPDTFRFAEALEAGCVPVVDRSAPRTDSERTYWETLFDDPPFPIVDRWSEFDSIADPVLANWPAVANRCFSWWQQQKRLFSYHLVDDLADLMGVDPDDDLGDPATQITVLMPSSPIAAHPDMSMIEKTVGSIRDRLGDCEIMVLVDGVRYEQEHRRRDYLEYVRRLLWKANTEWSNVVPIVHDRWLHQSGLTKAALPLVRTPLVLFVEHDTPLIGDFDWPALCAAIQSKQANVIRFHHEAEILQVHQHLNVGGPVTIAGCPLQGTSQWSQRPHLASTGFYRDMMARYFGRSARTFIEDVMHGVVDAEVRHDTAEGWHKFRLFMYTPDSPSIKRSDNLDGRGDEPKYGMIFAYDDFTPFGAPSPRRDEPSSIPSQLSGEPTICPCVTP